MEGGGMERGVEREAGKEGGRGGGWEVSVARFIFSSVRSSLS
jgi:hypothetical protein